MGIKNSSLMAGATAPVAFRLEERRGVERRGGGGGGLFEARRVHVPTGKTIWCRGGGGGLRMTVQRGFRGVVIALPLAAQPLNR